MKILIIKLGARGDVFRTTSIIRGLRKRYNNPEIWWVTDALCADLIRNNRHINKVVSYNENILNHLKRENFDLVLNLDEDMKACKIASGLNKKIIGFYLEDGKIVPTESAREYYNMGLLGKKPENDILKRKNKKTYQQLIAEIVGIKNEDNDLVYRLTKEQIMFRNDFRRRYNINNSDLVVGLNTGSGGRWPSKRLSVKKTAELAEIIHKKLNAKIILFGGSDEIRRNEEIAALARVPIISTGCGNDLMEFPALISICNIFVTSDSLGLHVALALKRKVVAFFGPTPANEIEMYGLGRKIISKSRCYCCYKPDCMATDAIKTEEIFNAVSELTKESVALIVTSFKEPNLEKTIESCINQDTDANYNIIIVSPDEHAGKLVERYSKKSKKISYFHDPGKGKSYAINMLLKKIKNDILVFTDGDVVLERNALDNMLNIFRDPQVGCVCGRIVSANNRNDKFGYWSHLLADAGAHRIRKELFLQGKFLECSGYLFGFRNIIKEIPLDVAEDTVIPYYFYQNGYNIGYAENAIVYVKNPTTFNDWIKQRKRTAKAHETLRKYVDVEEIPRVKTFWNEIRKGLLWALSYPKNLKEFVWTLMLFWARLYMWLNVMLDTKIFNRHYNDAWERVESTRLNLKN